MSAIIKKPVHTYTFYASNGWPELLEALKGYAGRHELNGNWTEDGSFKGSSHACDILQAFFVGWMECHRDRVQKTGVK